jgi:probable HAF family extracellular repeat protein
VSRTGDGTSRAFVWDGSSMRNIDTLNGSYSVGEFINDAGHVAGTALDVGDTPNARGFHWAGANMEDIGTLGGLYSFARGMNELGQVTGESSLEGDVEVHAFLWTNGLMQDLGTFGGTFSIGLDVNDVGQVTGYAYTLNNATSHGFLWQEGTLHNLNDLVDPADPLKERVTINEGRSINNRGYISALGTDTQSLTGTAYVLTPATPGDLRANTGTIGTGAAKTAFVRLAWSDAFSDESQFRIERARAVVIDGRSSCGAFKAIAIASQNAVRFLDTTVSRLTEYCYQLRVFSAAAVPTLSNVVRTKTK